MPSSTIARSTAFQRFSIAVVVCAVLLIWWGAATTTTDAGMAFHDWPLSLGSVNPEGWLSYAIPFWEHSHRLLATLVGVLVLVQFCWSYIRSGKQAIECVLITLLLGFVFSAYVKAGAERVDPEVKAALMDRAYLLSLLPLAWLIWGFFRQSWDFLVKCCALALIMVTTQAIFGGLRVTEISDALAVVHGCFGQLFFCLLVLIALSSRPSWAALGFTFSQRSKKWIRISSVILFGSVVMQLIWGASMRHHHRYGLADEGLLLTRGQLIPPLDDGIIALMFLHKSTGFLLGFFILGIFLLTRSFGQLGAGKPSRRLSQALLIMVAVQISLGLGVIASSKEFWVTNVHVLNGLGILAVSFVFAVRALRSKASAPESATV